jgi:hypothetical protein
MANQLIGHTWLKKMRQNSFFHKRPRNIYALKGVVVLVVGTLLLYFSPMFARAGGPSSEGVPIQESMELEFLETDPIVHLEIEQACDKDGCEWEFLTPDEEIASQLIFRWGAEIHCQHRILELEVDHPSTFEDSHAFALSGGAIFSTLTQTLPQHSPFKQGLVGTFKTQSLQVEDLKQRCLNLIGRGELDPYSEERAPEFFVHGESASRLFLRGTCATVNGLPTEMFNQPSASANQPDGVPYSPFVTVLCHAPGSPFAGLQLHTAPVSQLKSRQRSPQ